LPPLLVIDYPDTDWCKDCLSWCSIRRHTEVHRTCLGRSKYTSRNR